IVRGKAEKSGKKEAAAVGNEPSDVVGWLTPRKGVPAMGGSHEGLPQLVQQNKQFEPRLLVVKVRTLVEFPNKDHFFHNVFSLYDGKRFDLGFYEAGT